MPGAQDTGWYLGIRPWYQGIKHDTCGVSEGNDEGDVGEGAPQRQRMASRRHGEVRDVCSLSTWYLRYRLVPSTWYLWYQLGIDRYLMPGIRPWYQGIKHDTCEVSEGTVKRRRRRGRGRAATAEDDVEEARRAREREKSRGGAEEEFDGHTCCKSTRAAGVHPGGAKAIGRSRDDGDAEAEGEDEGSSRFCPPRGDDSPAHTRPTRAAS
uniref:Uncharacterized protein n=1 Tax=Oryza rufipogon TaxID=4529 RepID=A0A0E0R7I1_ORYRU